MNSNDIKKKLNEFATPVVIDINEEDDMANHLHMCDYEIIYKKPRIVQEKCRVYLRSIGMKRDKQMACCDVCKHMKYLQCSGDDPTDIVTIISKTDEDIERLEKVYSKWLRKITK